jgi:hypothetical protein
MKPIVYCETESAEGL